MKFRSFIGEMLSKSRINLIRSIKSDFTKSEKLIDNMWNRSLEKREDPDCYWIHIYLSEIRGYMKMLEKILK